MDRALEGKVAFITGAARGQGRNHAWRMAQAGADIIATDVCAGDELGITPYPLGTAEELAETAELVEGTGRRVVTFKADVRDQSALSEGVERGVATLGRLDIVCANAGIGGGHSRLVDMPEAAWQTMLDVNLTGVWRSVKAAVPHMVGGNRGGSIVITNSVAGMRAHANTGAYVAAKHGLVGVMRSLAVELAENSIRVNSIHPTQVDTPMVHNPDLYKLFVPNKERPSREDVAEVSRQINALPTPWVDPDDITSAVIFLASEAGRFITGASLPVDAGALLK